MSGRGPNRLLVELLGKFAKDLVREAHEAAALGLHLAPCEWGRPASVAARRSRVGSRLKEQDGDTVRRGKGPARIQEQAAAVEEVSTRDAEAGRNQEREPELDSPGSIAASRSAVVGERSIDPWTRIGYSERLAEPLECQEAGARGARERWTPDRTDL